MKLKDLGVYVINEEEVYIKLDEVSNELISGIITNNGFAPIDTYKIENYFTLEENIYNFITGAI